MKTKLIIGAISFIGAIFLIGVYLIYGHHYERYTNPLRYDLRQAGKVKNEIYSIENIINRIEGEKLANPSRKDLDSEINKMERRYNNLIRDYTLRMEQIRKKYNRNDIEREGKHLDNE